MTLDLGSHRGVEEGTCWMEAVSVFAGEPFSSQPDCVHPDIVTFGWRLNDLMDDVDRQRLTLYIPLVVGTRWDGREAERREAMGEWARAMVTYVKPECRLADNTRYADLLDHVTGFNRRVRVGYGPWGGLAAESYRLLRYFVPPGVLLPATFALLDRMLVAGPPVGWGRDGGTEPRCPPVRPSLSRPSEHGGLAGTLT